MEGKGAPEGGGEESGPKGTPAQQPPGFVVRITNIPGKIDESSLHSVMSHFGKVESCTLVLGEAPTDPASAWVVYGKREEMEAALKADGKLECGGCKLKISRWEGEVPAARQDSKRRLTDASTCQDSCWFCLANRDCESHMVSYVAKHCYVAVAKGSLSEMHTLVVPIYHYPNLGAAPLDVQMDVREVVDSLFDLALERGMGAIAFERFAPMSMRVAMHTQVQVVPVALDKALSCIEFVDKSELFADATRVAFEAEDIGFHSLASKVNTTAPYLYLQAVGKSLKADDKVAYAKCLWVFDRPGSGKIPTHFGREIALAALPHAELRNIRSLKNYVQETGMSPELAAVDWHNCVATKEEETRYARNVAKLLLGVK